LGGVRGGDVSEEASDDKGEESGVDMSDMLKKVEKTACEQRGTINGIKYLTKEW